MQLTNQISTPLVENASNAPPTLGPLRSYQASSSPESNRCSPPPNHTITDSSKALTSVDPTQNSIRVPNPCLSPYRHTGSRAGGEYQSTHNWTCRRNGQRHGSVNVRIGRLHRLRLGGGGRRDAEVVGLRHRYHLLLVERSCWLLWIRRVS